MSWRELPITGGVVKTRNPSALETGELVSATNCRLKKNDTKQLHNDLAPTLLATQTVVAGPFYLSFEGTDDKLMIVTSTDILTADPAVGTFASIQTFVGTATKAGVIHRGNEWFVGTDAENYVITDNVARLMGMDDAGWPFAANTGAGVLNLLSVTATTSAVQKPAFDTPSSNYDHVAYWATEYDSTNDVESGVVAASKAVFDNALFAGDNTNQIAWDNGTITYQTKKNATADKLRIYRTYTGRSTTLDTGNEWLKRLNIESKGQDFIGGRIAEVDWTDLAYIDSAANYPSKFDSPIPYPSIYTDPITGGSIFRHLVKPADWDLGVLFQDSLVVNDPGTSKQILRYSPPGQPEYQPTPYFMYFANESSDEIVGLHVVGGKLLVLTTGGVHKVNWLPLGGRVVQGQGRAQEVLTERVGCVGRSASVKIETEAGEFLVWLSRRGLEWTNGSGWADACPDFSSASISGTIANVVLAADPDNFRVRLYDGTTVWDFYYHPSHLKNNRLKLMGPSAYPITVQGATTGPLSDKDGIWTASSAAVYREGPGNNATDTVLTTGQLKAGPFDDVAIDGVGVDHTANSATTYKVKGTSKLMGSSEVPDAQRTIEGEEYAEISRLAVEDQVGQWNKQELTIGGSEAWGAGPLWLDVEVRGGDNG